MSQQLVFAHAVHASSPAAGRHAGSTLPEELEVVEELELVEEVELLEELELLEQAAVQFWLEQAAKVWMVPAKGPQKPHAAALLPFFARQSVQQTQAVSFLQAV